MGEKFSSKILLFCIFCFSFYSSSMQTDAPRYVKQEYKEYFDLGNGIGISVQRNGYFIEDENGNVFYTEKSKTQFIEKPAYLEGEGKVIYEESSQIEHFVERPKLEEDSDVSIGTECIGDFTDEEKDFLVACRDNFRREFSRDVNRIFNTGMIYSAWNGMPHQVGDIPPYIGSRNSYHPDGNNKFIQQFSMYKIVNGVVSIRTDYEHFIKKFCNDVVSKYTGMYVDWSSVRASLNTLSRLEHALHSHKKLKKKALNRLENIFGKNYLNLFINTYKLDLNERLRVENFEKTRIAERTEHERFGKQRAAQEMVIHGEVDKLTKKLSSRLMEATHGVDIGETRNATLELAEKQWLEAELKLQQQEGTIFLNEEKLAVLENMRCYLDKIKHIEASKTYLKMLKQAEIEQHQNDGRISKKLYNRLIAAHVAINNKFECKTHDYILNNYAHRFVTQNMCDVSLLEKCSGNGIQHNVHGEIVGLVNRYSYYLHANSKDISGDGPNLYEAANIALDMKSKLDGEEDVNTRIYERTYSFLDFCHNLLKVKIGQTALNLWMRFGKGLELGGEDIQRALQNGLKGCFSSGALDSDDLLSDVLNGKESFEKILEKQQAFFESKRQELGDSITNLFQKVRNQPLEEAVGDALEFLSRKLVQTSAIILTVLGVAAVAEAGVAAAAGIGSAIAAKRLLEPFVVNITADGTAVLDKAVCSGVSVCQSAASSLNQAVQSLYGLSGAANNLCFAVQGGDDGVNQKSECYIDGCTGLEKEKTPFEVARDGGKHSGFLDNYKKRSVHEIRSGIKSLKKQISKHKDCIENPQKYYPDFYELDPRHQEDLIKVKWPGDIARQTDHLNILEELLKLK